MKLSEQSMQCRVVYVVTVWALEQEEPQKTVAKWTRIPAPVVDGVEPDTEMALLEGGAAASSVPRGDDVSFDVTSHTAGKAGVEAPPSQTGTGSEGGDKGADFMVPWHLPFHRAGVAATRQDAGQLAANEGWQAAVQVLPQTLPGQQADASVARGDENRQPTGATAVINAAKGSVVYQRYYHLFEEGELPQLAQALPGCSVVQTFYDKSNWCVVIRRDAA
ncbi:Fe2OG dioxygenase domain-containing protein [Haematococcus lacustris]|uniref:Fe2OG dioxygenase domain-containing protein n=1 Tax=Haematococcus lacustris TaxID=44745 RepID=A0A699ZBW8_HAELA|nr:Fe2OG dioxygenase domain-containing protein [Haematococcus lacustris]